MGFNVGSISGTMIDAQGRVVLKQQPALNSRRIRVEGREIGAPRRTGVPGDRLVAGDVVNEIIRRQEIIVFCQIKVATQFKLFEIAQTIDVSGPVLRLAHRRQQQPRENGDDGDDHEEFNQREPVGETNSPRSFVGWRGHGGFFEIKPIDPPRN
jgi:hypothetical protein